MTFESVLRSLASLLGPPAKGDESEVQSDAGTRPAGQVLATHPQKVLGYRPCARDLHTAVLGGSSEDLTVSLLTQGHVRTNPKQKSFKNQKKKKM